MAGTRKKPAPKKPTDRALTKVEKFLSLVEAAAIDVARRQRFEIVVERDTRGRYATFTLRAIGEIGKEDKIVKERHVDGLKIK